jgi:hypothetical protein
MVRHSKDLKLILDILLGENVKRINKIPKDKPLRILYMENDGGSPLATPMDPELVECVRKTVQHLEKKFGVKAQVSRWIFTTLCHLGKVIQIQIDPKSTCLLYHHQTKLRNKSFWSIRQENERTSEVFPISSVL